MEIDLIGIFLPPASLMSVRERHERREVTEAELIAAEDDAVLDMIERQLDSGVKRVTSGGVRWTYWDKDFFFGLNGIAKERLDSGRVYCNEDVLTDLMRFTDRIAYNPGHPYFDDFRLLSDAVGGRAVCRQIIPSPAELYVHVLRMTAGNPGRVYPASGELLSDIAEVYRLTILHFYELGCRSIVLDDTVCGRLCEDNFAKRFLQGGIDTVELQDKIIYLFNESLSGLPADLETCIYLSGGDVVVPEWEYIRYPDNIMPRVLSEVNAGKFFMPFNAEDDYSVEILRHVPSGKKVVLGLTEAHTPFPDNVELVRHFVTMAQQYVKPDALSVGPKTGFNLSSFSSRGLDYNNQWEKLKSLGDIAAEIEHHTRCCNV